MSSSAALIMDLAGDFGTGNNRAGAIVAGVVALLGTVIAGFALVRSGRSNATRRSITSLAVSLTGVAFGWLHLATSSGGIGTGNGRAGAYIAIAVGLIGAALGTLAVARSRRNST
jgi:uncharacterized protein DUF6223